jgi:hypothetical protein
MVVFDGVLLAGGSFTTAGETKAPGIAAFDGEGWTPLGDGIAGWVSALHVHADALIAGGQFQLAGGDSARRVAMWDGRRWAPLGAGLGAEPDAGRRSRRRTAPQEVVYAFTTYEDALIAGGVFLSSADTPLANVARWDGTAWQPMGEGLDGEVRAFTEHRGRLVAGGKFRMSGETLVNHVAAWDGDEWQPLGSRLALSPGLGKWVFALQRHGDDVVAGGCFIEIGSEETEFLARWDGTSWWPIATGLDHCVNALARWRGAIYVGGGFDRAGLGPCRYLARWAP